MKTKFLFAFFAFLNIFTSCEISFASENGIFVSEQDSQKEQLQEMGRIIQSIVNLSNEASFSKNTNEDQKLPWIPHEYEFLKSPEYTLVMFNKLLQELETKPKETAQTILGVFDSILPYSFRGNILLDEYNQNLGKYSGMWDETDTTFLEFFAGIIVLHKRNTENYLLKNGSQIMETFANYLSDHGPQNITFQKSIVQFLVTLKNFYVFPEKLSPNFLRKIYQKGFLHQKFRYIEQNIQGIPYEEEVLLYQPFLFRSLTAPSHLRGIIPELEFKELLRDHNFFLDSIQINHEEPNCKIRVQPILDFYQQYKDVFRTPEDALYDLKRDLNLDYSEMRENGFKKWLVDRSSAILGIDTLESFF